MGKNKIKRIPQQNPAPCPSRGACVRQHTLGRAWRAAMGPLLGPAAASSQDGSRSLQRAGRAKPALGSPSPDSRSTACRAGLCREERGHQGRDAAPLGVVALWERDVALRKGDVAPLLSSAP